MRLAVKVALAAAGVFAGLWSLALYVVAVDLQADKERRRLKWAQAMGQDFYAILGCPRSADEASPATLDSSWSAQVQADLGFSVTEAIQANAHSLPGHRS